LEAFDLTYRYPGSPCAAVRGITLRTLPGRLTGIIGPNGAGKSTLARLFAGILTPSSGRVRVLGRPVEEWSRADLARRLAVVAQEASRATSHTVTDYVSLGRNPYVSAWAPLTTNDRHVVAEAIERLGLSDLARRRLHELSGGELQRARLARALAQEPEILILDEPTAHLDMGHALRTFENILGLVGERGIGALFITHDINLASRYGHEVTLMSGGTATVSGTPSEVLRPRTLAEAYGCAVDVEDRGATGYVVLPVVGTLP